MQRYLIAGLLSAVAAVGVSTLAAGQDAESTTDSTPTTCDLASPTAHIKQARATINAGWHLRNWRQGPKKAQARAVSEHITCLRRGKDRKAIQRHRAGAKAELASYRAYRRITPYRCQSGLYGTWAIPCYIIACESGFSWSAANPTSSAAGPYQIMEGRVWPVTSWADKMQHHRRAAEIWAGGSGRSAWVC